MRISVVIPVHDGEAFLAQTIRSALNQTRPPDRIVVVDDGSSDRSAAIAKGFASEGVMLIRGHFGGAAAARLAGLKHTDDDALMFLDADDLLGPTVLEELAAVLERNPGAIACCPWMRLERDGGCWLARPASCAPRRPGQDALSAWLTDWYHPPCSVLWSRAAYDASGGWDRDVPVNNDGDLMMRAFLADVALVPTAGGTAYYRRLPDGAVSLSGHRFTRRGLDSRLKVLDRIARRLEQAGRIDRYRSALAEAYGALADDAVKFGDLARRARDAAQIHGGDRLLRRRFWHAVARYRPGGPKPSAAIATPSPAPDVQPDACTSPLVSVVVPTFNRSDDLARALHSVLAQSYPHFEVLVVDDGSSEDIAGLVANMRDPRLRTLRQSKNRGVAAARNRGMADAAGPLIAFLDSDDEWLPDKLSRQVDLIRQRPPRVGLVYTGVVELGAHNSRTVTIPTARGDVWAEMLHRNVVHYGTSSVMIRREVIETVGHFDETLPAIEDYDYWTRIARFYEFDFVPEALILYHNEPPAEGAPPAKRSQDFDANMRARQMYLDRYGLEAERAGSLHRFHLDMARRHLELPDGKAGRARLHLLKALRRRPTEPRLHAWMMFALIPRPLRRRIQPQLARLRRRLPRRLWFGSAG